MGEVVAIGRGIPDNGQEPPHRGLRTQSRMLAGVVTLALWGVLLFNGAVLALGLVFGGAFLSIGPGSAYLGSPPAGLPDIVPFGSLPLATRLAYAATLVLNTAPVVLVLRHLRGLFRLYAAGTVFAAENGARIRRIGLWLAAYAIAPFLGHQLVRLAGHGVDHDWFHASAVQALLLGAVLFVIAQVMEVGRVIEQDRDGFV